MRYPAPLHAGVLLRRYKRFFVDVETPNGIVTLHCPNTGAMTGCAEPGSEVRYCLSDSPRRKLPGTLELVRGEGGWIGVNTHRANALVIEALAARRLQKLRHWQVVQREVTVGSGSRIDLLLGSRSGQVKYAEVKSVTWLVGNGLGLFPDAVSVRAARHLDELTILQRMGQACALIYCVQHEGIDRVAAARERDERYAAALCAAVRAGVEVLAYGVSVEGEEISLARRLRVVVD